MAPRRALLLVGLMVVSLVALGTVGPPVGAGNDTVGTEYGTEPGPDFADPEDGNQTVGWFDGYWYNEPLDIDVEDGITEEELEKLSARTAARFETMRNLTFEEIPPVEIISREDFINETAAQFDNVSQEEQLRENAQFETLLTIPSTQDAIEVREESRGATVGGYYNFVEERIVVISDDPDSLMIDEEVLAHELGHALQDQHFNLEEYHRPTKDIDNAKLGVIEGDVHLIEQEYLERCDSDEWGEPCLTQDEDSAGDTDGPPNWGLYFMQFQPYSDGPTFIDYIYADGGWEAVNELYDDMPASSQQVIIPEKYPDHEPENLTVNSSPSGDWERMTVERGPDHNVIGKGGMSAMFMGQSQAEREAGNDEEAILTAFQYMNFNFTTGELDNTDPLNYDLQATDGWTGDRLYTYRNGANETGTVWKTAWEDGNQLSQFLSAYEELIGARGGTEVDKYPNTWEFGSESEYDMALRTHIDDDRLWIVTAPSVEELDNITDEIDPLVEEEDNGIDRPEPSPGERDDDSDDLQIGDDDDTTDPGTDDDAVPEPGDDTDDTVPGFGLLAGVIAMLLAGLWLLTGRSRF